MEKGVAAVTVSALSWLQVATTLTGKNLRRTSRLLRWSTFFNGWPLVPVATLFRINRSFVPTAHLFRTDFPDQYQVIS